MQDQETFKKSKIMKSLFSRVYNCKYQTLTPLFPDKAFDWAIVDIPYGINVTKMKYLTETKARVKQKNGTVLNGNRTRKKYHPTDWDNQTPGQAFFDEICRISRNQIVFGIDYVDWEGVGSGRIKWDKCVPEGVSFKQFETAYCSCINHEEEVKLLWSGFQQAESLLNPTKPQGNKSKNQKRIHPCMKPVLLYDWILNRFVTPGQRIIDTHMGSGSLRLSAHKHQCHFIGIEADEIYFNDHVNWYEEQMAQISIDFTF